jgi:hypothetical protein
MTYFIGLGHYSRTGKDTLANYLLHEFASIAPDVTCVKRSFAWKLKQICAELYGWAGVREPEFYDTAEGEKERRTVLPALNLSPVDLWVLFGTQAVRRTVYQHTWVDYVLKSSHEDVVIIPDVRFPNEVNAIRQSGGILIKVVRPGVEPLDTVADHALVNYDGWDYVVGRSGELQELADFASWLAPVVAAPLCYALTPKVSK